MIYPENCYLEEPLIFDSHAHLDDSKFDDCRNKLICQMQAHGVDGIITCGCDLNSSKKALLLAEKYNFIYAAIGIHPGNISSGDTIYDIEKLICNKKCVAIGEIGLDYYWDKENINIQKEIFISQIKLAKKYDLPVIVHDREAHLDTLEILKEYKPKGVVHCFSGSVESAKEILKLGMYIGIGGVITFKNAKKLPDVVTMLPDDKILIETDCPYLAPEPLRGKLCHSGLISLTAEKIAEIRGCSKEDILRLTAKNAKKLFGI